MSDILPSGDMILGDREGINGIGVLRYPAHGMVPTTDGTLIEAQHLTKGSVICLPNTRDGMGEYEWDFKIVGGPAEQVTVKREEGPPSDASS